MKNWDINVIQIIKNVIIYTTWQDVFLQQLMLTESPGYSALPSSPCLATPAVCLCPLFLTGSWTSSNANSGMSRIVLVCPPPPRLPPGKFGLRSTEAQASWGLIWLALLRQIDSWMDLWILLLKPLWLMISVTLIAELNGEQDRYVATSGKWQLCLGDILIKLIYAPFCHMNVSQHLISESANAYEVSKKRNLSSFRHI